MSSHIINMCTHTEYIKYGMQLCVLLLYITQIPRCFDGISAAMNSFPCWLDVADAESPDCNDYAKSFGQLV